MHAFKFTAVSLALILGLPLSVQAKDNFEFHEEQWKNVPVHEKTMVSDDSVTKWGAWVDVAPTAAGPGVSGPAVGFAPAPAPVVYRPVAEVAPIVTPARVRPPRPCKKRCE